MHYSSTAFIYAWLNLVVRGGTTEQDRVLTALHWFRERYTASLYPIAGPSMRKYNCGNFSIFSVSNKHTKINQPALCRGLLRRYFEPGRRFFMDNPATCFLHAIQLLLQFFLKRRNGTFFFGKRLRDGAFWIKFRVYSNFCPVAIVHIF